MDTREFGKTIAHLRVSAGYTQKTLADALDITDKAVSKWERGLACPDISLLPRLSALLDVDMDIMFSGLVSYRGHDWLGILLLDGCEAVNADTYVYDKPLVYYLLSTFLLVGIREIIIIAGSRECDAIEMLLGDGQALGVKLYCIRKRQDDLGTVLEASEKSTQEKNVLLIYGRKLLYGMNLTRQLQAVMSQCAGTSELRLKSGSILPMLFCHKDAWQTVQLRCRSIHGMAELRDALLDKYQISTREIGRGMIALPLESNDDIVNASFFVRLVQAAGGESLSSLEEIAWRRGYTSNEDRER